MDKTRKLINENKERFPEFQYYHSIIDKIEENIEIMPDISIESCKSLIEGVSKTILDKLGIQYVEKGRDAHEPRKLFEKALDSIPQSESHEQEFLSKVSNLILRMTEIRNARGDISHGKSSPKKECSSIILADFIAQVTDSSAQYLLKIYFSADLSPFEETKYEDNAEFNQILDDEYPLDGIISFSRALFEQDPISYKEQLKNSIENNIG